MGKQTFDGIKRTLLIASVLLILMTAIASAAGGDASYICNQGAADGAKLGYMDGSTGSQDHLNKPPIDPSAVYPSLASDYTACYNSYYLDGYAKGLAAKTGQQTTTTTTGTTTTGSSTDEYNKGFKEGYRQGYTDGYTTGKQNPRTFAVETDNSRGYADGYDAGFKAGSKAGSKAAKRMPSAATTT